MTVDTDPAVSDLSASDVDGPEADGPEVPAPVEASERGGDNPEDSDEAAESGFRVKLRNFEGPFDLLLNLISQQRSVMGDDERQATGREGAEHGGTRRSERSRHSPVV